LKNQPEPKAASDEGFSANLTGAGLPDLVQMECLGNSTLVVRVVSGDDEGYLYFHDGQVVHAMSSNAVGEPAALEILGWNRGTFEPCNAGWPSELTITKPWQALIMSAATARDEARRKVVDFPRERTNGTTMSQKPPLPIPSQSSSRMPSTAPARSSLPSGLPPSTRSIDRAVKLDADGRVLSTRGDAEELAAMTAYTLRVSALVGDELGMGDLRAVESLAGSTRRLFYREADGNLIGLEAPTEAELGPLREKLGL
jgi:hypothetical protein